MLQDKLDSVLSHLIRERILLLDGAMGTMIQRLGLSEADVRGERFAEHNKDLKALLEGESLFIFFLFLFLFFFFFFFWLIN